MSIRAVHHLNCATMCPLAGFLFGGSGLGRGRLVTHCVLLETERDGLILIDTGFGTRDLAGETHMPRSFRAMVGPVLKHSETAIAQIAGLGLAPDDVRHIVITHLDLDHAGGLADFPRATVHLHEREHAAATARATAIDKQRYLPEQWAHGPRWELYSEAGDTWRGLPAINRLRGVDADVGLLPMHGHTRGHSAILARAGERWLVDAGDAYYHRASLDGARSVPAGLAALERMMQVDGPARRASLAALRQLHERYDDLDIFSAHDPAELDAFHPPA